MLQGGVDLSWVRWIADDGIGRRARNGLNFTERGFGVRAALGCSDRGHTAVSQLKAGEVDWERLFGSGVRWFHTGGVFAALSETTPRVGNVKIGPGMPPGELLDLIQVLNPHDEPGRLTLIHRMGLARIASNLPPLVEAVRRAGRTVLWCCDPMHGNTITAASGRKWGLCLHLFDDGLEFLALLQQEITRRHAAQRVFVARIDLLRSLQFLQCRRRVADREMHVGPQAQRFG